MRLKVYQGQEVNGVYKMVNMVGDGMVGECGMWEDHYQCKPPSQHELHTNNTLHKKSLMTPNFQNLNLVLKAPSG